MTNERALVILAVLVLGTVLVVGELAISLRRLEEESRRREARIRAAANYLGGSS